jgi:hypothetical protein
LQVFLATCVCASWLILVSGATAGTICNLCSSSLIRKQCCDTGYLGSLVVLIYQNDVFSSRHAIGALWNLVVDNDGAKIALASDDAFCHKMVELFRHSDIQVRHTVRVRSCSDADAGQVSKHALGLASEMCCRCIEAKELFCNEYRMVCARLHALPLNVSPYDPNAAISYIFGY